MVSNIIAKSAFNITKSILYLVQLILDVFSYFSGTKGLNATDSFLYKVISNTKFNLIFRQVLIISGTIFFLVTIFMLFKTLTNKETHIKGKIVINNTLKAMMTFVLLPIILVMMFNVINFIGGQLSKVSNIKPHKEIVLTVIGVGITEDSWTADAESQKMYSSNPEERELAKEKRDAFFSMIREGKYGYDDIKNSQVINMDKIDVSSMLFLSIILIIAISYLLVEFITRGVKVVYLYLVSPIIVSIMALDNGRGLKEWFKNFLEVFLSGYIMIFLLNVFLFVYGSFQDILIFQDIRKNKIIFSIGYAFLIMLVPVATEQVCRLLNIGGYSDKKKAHNFSMPGLFIFNRRDNGNDKKSKEKPHNTNKGDKGKNFKITKKYPGKRFNRR